MGFIVYILVTDIDEEYSHAQKRGFFAASITFILALGALHGFLSTYAELSMPKGQ